MRTQHKKRGGDYKGGSIPDTPPTRHTNPPLQTQFNIGNTEIDFAFSRANEAYKISFTPNNATQSDKPITESCEALNRKLEKFRNRRKALKFNLKLEIVFEKSDDEEIYTDPPIFIYTQQHELYTASPTAEVLQDMAKELMENIEKFELTGSGFIIRNLYCYKRLLAHL